MHRVIAPIPPVSFVDKSVKGYLTLHGVAQGAPWSEMRIKSRLEEHGRALASVGADDIANLSTLKIDGVKVVQSGVLTPLLQLNNLPPTLVSQVRRIKSGAVPAPVAGGQRRLDLEQFGATAELLPVKRFAARNTASGRISRTTPRFFTSFAVTTTLPLNTAYWAAKEIEIADGTVVILRPPHRFLVIIAEKISVGANVTFTWERPVRSAPPKPGTPPAPATRGRAEYLSGSDATGTAGTEGEEGRTGPAGDAGAEIEVWTLEMTGNPAFDVAGQDGAPGGAGGDGGPGGKGGKGTHWVAQKYTGGTVCESGPGTGGKGGRGGDGGRGGRGGRGGDGGRFTLFAPQATINAYAAGFYVDENAGRGGAGGPGGKPGPGGAGGKAGGNRSPVGCPTDYGKDGGPGSAGSEGSPGDPGADGAVQNEPVGLHVITLAQFVVAFNKPAIFTLSSPSAVEGDDVTAFGKNFQNTDKVMIEGIACPTTYVSDTLIKFTVPAVPGGHRPVYVSQADGTLSNRATIYIRPVLTLAPDARFKPGVQATLKGSGFAPQCRVRIHDMEVKDGDVVYKDPHTLLFTPRRPKSLEKREEWQDGEEVEIAIVLTDGTESNAVRVLLDTYRIVVFGDSIQWGQGLQDKNKFSFQVEEVAQVRHPEFGVYRTVRAHSGATIGVGDNVRMPALDGEVPTSYPTILQQVDDFVAEFGAGAADRVELVLLDGGINDVAVNEIVNPLSNVNISSTVKRHCGKDMETLLKKVSQVFPSAKLVVTGYYTIVSEDSDFTALALFLSALGLLATGSPLAALVGPAVTPVVRTQIADRCSEFSTAASKALKDAVATVNAADPAGANRISFAQPAFGHKNALFADNAWLWGVGADLSPVDDENKGGVETSRGDACVLVGSPRTDVARCIRASAGHPNVAGAKEYARVINALGL